MPLSATDMDNMNNAAHAISKLDKVTSNNQFWENIANQIVIDPKYKHRIYADWTASGRLF